MSVRFVNRRLVVIVAVLMLACVTTASARGIVVKISGEMPEWGDVAASFEVMPTHRVGVYMSDQRVDEFFELFAAPVDGSKLPILVGGPIAYNDNIRFYVISPDERYVAYVAMQDLHGQRELFSGSLTDGVVTRLYGDSISDHQPNRMFFTPDSKYLVFNFSNEPQDIRSVPVAGGQSVRLNPDGFSEATEQFNWEYRRILLTHDSSHAVFASRKDSTGEFALLSVPVEGGPAQNLSGMPNIGTNLLGFVMHPEQDVVFYLTQTGLDIRLFQVPALGGTPVKLSETTMPAIFARLHEVRITSDGAHITFLAPTAESYVYDLYSAPISGESIRKISAEHVGSFPWIGIYSLSHDGAFVIYRGVDDTVNANLYRVAIAGGQSVRLDTGDGDMNVFRFVLSPDTRHVAYLGRIKQNGGPRAVFSVPADGGVVVRLDKNPSPDRNVDIDLDISPDSQSVLYIAEQDTDNVYELYSVPITGGDSTKVNGRLTAGGNVRYAAYTPDGSAIIYAADQDHDERVELYSVLNDAAVYLPSVAR